MSDKDGEKHVFSYMDGIPVKISEKYKPPRKIVLPVGFQNRLLQPPVCPDYDFQLEHDVLDKIEQWRLSRFAEKEKRKQRLAEEDAERNKMRETMQEIEKTMHELSTDEGSPSKSQPTPSQSPAPVPTVLQQAIKVQQAQPAVSLQPSSGTPVPVISEVNPILRPIPFKHQVVTSQMNNNKPISAFNLSDFEADTSSPFDNMELKTINDLEELAQVLQPTTTSQTQDYYLNTRPSEEHYANALHQSVNCHGTSMEQPFNVPGSNNILNDAKHGMNYQPHVNGFTSNYDYNSMQGYHPHPVIAQHGQAAAYNFAEREHMSQPNDISFYTRQDPHHPLANYYSANAWPSAGYQPTRQPSYGAAAVSENRTEVSNIGNIKLLPSSSIDRTEERSPDGTEGSVSQMAQQLSDLMKSRSSRYHQKPSEESTPENSSSVQSPTSPTEPDPFESLQSESQFLVRKIAEMGFPRARVARACQKLGTNDKKIVEFLLSLESLLDAGYQEGRAEHALSMHNQDLQATTKYLQVESQLLDLGFPVDRVSEALVKFNCDRDQALEFLIS